ncbi:outer membrane protein assembly factor BamB family protein [Aeoliella mucimassa]|uniref:Outer membrane biogenesis protein BamB n=1 Tax=Aeoliella mucimassa TaxID=2527972 RepID=A0A518AK67_9BACT|nr:PQQ-binding-like beta-propeller repeat protein [Aeoliella mucimassa]QDU55128.1 outer membrane biogenesis protein BamB [Aeoliella mucimassa]
MSSEPAEVTTNKPRAWWRRYFPLCWWALMLLLAALVLVLGSHGMESDRQTVALIAIANLSFLVPLGWLLFAWPPVKQLGYWPRWGLRLLVAALLVLGFMSIDVQYDGDGNWRQVRFAWQAAPDEQLAELSGNQVASGWQTTPNDYPGFLGGRYWAEATNVTLSGDWQAIPPEMMWKQDIGAGWSAFAVVGDYAVTQEQRGDQELVSCYHIDDGNVVWTHADTSRHDPGDVGGGMGGVGPRATPTLHEGRVYTMGATGIVNCLDSETGDVIWSHNMPDEYQVEPLLWGNSSSPLIVPEQNLVVIAAGQAAEDYMNSLYAFDLATGKIQWSTGPPTTSYASPVLATIGGVLQVVHVNESSVGGYRVTDGEELWRFEQPGSSSADASCSQAIPLPNDQVLVSKGYGVGARLVQISKSNDGSFEATTIWEKRVLKTKLSNLVIRDGYAYGLDHTLLSCVEIETGKVAWKKRRNPNFGHGQLLLVGDYLFAITEQGEGVLLDCTPEKYSEVAHLQMLTDEGITWNNPALSGDRLLVRNNLEAACYRLPTASEPPTAGESASESPADTL